MHRRVPPWTAAPPRATVGLPSLPNRGGLTMTAAPLILALDDDPALLRLYRALCADEGWHCEGWTAPRGPAAVAALDPDLVLFELVLAGEPLGLGFAAALRASPATAGIPLVACTGAVAATARYGTQFAAWGCPLVTKPFDLDGLVAVIWAALRAPTPAARRRPFVAGEVVGLSAPHAPLRELTASD